MHRDGSSPRISDRQLNYGCGPRCSLTVKKTPEWLGSCPALTLSSPDFDLQGYPTRGYDIYPIKIGLHVTLAIRVVDILQDVISPSWPRNLSGQVVSVICASSVLIILRRSPSFPLLLSPALHRPTEVMAETEKPAFTNEATQDAEAPEKGEIAAQFDDVGRELFERALTYDTAQLERDAKKVKRKLYMIVLPIVRSDIPMILYCV